LKETLNVNVSTYICDADDPESERIIDHADPIHREWLQRHIFWCLRNDREVHLQKKMEETE
jgi:hypothetical protein